MGAPPLAPPESARADDAPRQAGACAINRMLPKRIRVPTNDCAPLGSPIEGLQRYADPKCRWRPLAGGGSRPTHPLYGADTALLPGPRLRRRLRVGHVR